MPTQKLLVILFLSYCSLFFLARPHLPTLDLGRHITNGREIIANRAVFEDNHYSHTSPDFPAVNHHWLFGVFAFLGYELGGFPLLVVSNTLLNLLAIAGVLLVASKISSPKSALVAGVVLLPLLIDRNQVRPETISFFFSSIFLVVLWFQTRNQRLWLMVLVALQVIWVNSHLFFIFGPGLVGAYFLRSVFVQKFRWQLKSLGITLLGVSLASFLNPVTWRGVVQPFTIFSDYAYPVAENQSVWFFLKFHPASSYWYSALVLIITLGMAVYVWRQKKTEFLPLILITAVFAIAGEMVTRVLSFFALLSIPLLAISFDLIWKRYSKTIHRLQSNYLAVMAISTVSFVGLLISIRTNLFVPNLYSVGVHETPNANASAEFFKTLHPSGNIFNNYDIGGYLIFHLYPDYKVFIDNRPEAYPSSFIENEYIAAQKDEAVWEDVAKKYDIGSIFVYYRDRTDWFEPFIIRRLDDPRWVAVYADQDAIILLEDRPENADLIAKYQLPDEVFSY
ncbi:MAG: hypothetical protein COY80_03810 [Candidatus Pacebacteria bacterium CG_4_10_14_0_8_um_filter_42_14]|nr:MAG: hypothetical protein COY80_03810 [Candidatus Pacebacteria bacterium CG_4_10_14_0_8_um_filter_42_14]